MKRSTTIPAYLCAALAAVLCAYYAYRGSLDSTLGWLCAAIWAYMSAQSYKSVERAIDANAILSTELDLKRNLIEWHSRQTKLRERRIKQLENTISQLKANKRQATLNSD